MEYVLRILNRLHFQIRGNVDPLGFQSVLCVGQEPLFKAFVRPGFGDNLADFSVMVGP